MLSRDDEADGNFARQHWTPSYFANSLLNGLDNKRDDVRFIGDLKKEE
jgi:hypothetical protein